MKRRSFVDYFLYMTIIIAISGVVVSLIFVLTPTGQKIVRSFKAVTTEVFEGMSAPGVKEIISTGCHQGYISTVGKISEVLESLPTGAKTKKPGADTKDLPLVVCRVDYIASHVPSCAEVAATYQKAVSPKSRFLVIVVQPGETTCAESFSATGARLDSIKGFKPEN